MGSDCRDVVSHSYSPGELWQNAGRVGFQVPRKRRCYWMGASVSQVNALCLVCLCHSSFPKGGWSKTSRLPPEIPPCWFNVLSCLSNHLRRGAGLCGLSSTPDPTDWTDSHADHLKRVPRR